MSFREVNVPLGFPGTAEDLSKLGNTILEGIVYGSYKDVLLGEQEYETDGVVFILGGNLMLSFTPQFAGLHTGRIFSDGQEICRPVAFRITLNGKVVRADGTSRKESASLSPLRQPVLPTSISGTFKDSDLPEQDDDSVFTHTSSISHSRSAYSDTALMRPKMSRNISGINLLGPSGMPVSVPEEGAAVDIPQYSGTMQLTSFNDLYSQKYSGIPQAVSDVESTRREILTSTLGPGNTLTPETIELLEKDASLRVKRRACEVCTKKQKSERSITMWGFSFCSSCFKRQYFKHNTIEHFMIPTIKQVQVEIPINKKFGRRPQYMTVMKCLPTVNLRGLKLDMVRQAKSEFQRFCITNDGWIDKAFILLMIKSHFTDVHNLTDQQITFLLSTKSFNAMMESMGLLDRDRVHEVEYLALLAFVAREKHLLGPSKPSSKSDFTTRDLAVVYAVKGTLSPSVESASRFRQPSLKRSNGEGLSTMTADQERGTPVGGLARSTDDTVMMRPKRVSVNEDTRVKRLSNISSQTNQLSKLTQERTEKREITPIHRKKSTTAELMDEMKLTGSSADGWMLY